MIRVVIVDDDELVRTGLAAIVGAQPDIDVVGQASDGAQVPDVVAQTSPDVVVMDVRMPVVDGIVATERLMASNNPPQVIVITTFEHDSYVIDALRVGARGFVLKRAPAEHLLSAIRVVATTDALLFPDSIRELASYVVTTPHEPSWRSELTEREDAVLALVAKGLSNAEIGQELFIGTETVKSHVSALLAKLGCRDRTALAIKALTD